MKQNLLLLFALCGFSYTHAQDNKNGLVINEIMQSNVECIMDDIHEFPDSWVELYNASGEDINLKDYKISNKNKEKEAWQLPDKALKKGEYIIIYCDKEGKKDNRLHADFRLESGKDCALYLFNKDKEVIDSLPSGMKKMPAPDVAFGRKTDGADEWGYQLTPTPGKANTGDICDNKHILGAPVFSEKGRVTSSNETIKLELSLPEGAPEGAYITYTTNGDEPKADVTSTCKKYTTAFNITKTTVIRAKVFCDGWLSPMSTAQSYIFHPRKMTIPVFSMQINDLYLHGKDSLGLFEYNNSKEDKKKCDWRRPMNVEFFPVEGEESAFNQLGETRIQGGQSRSNALRSMVFYANKRFDPDHKRYSYEFFPDQKPGIKEFKSFSLRDGGNDFGYLYFRDLIIQRTMGQHVDLDWQAGHSAVLYINGEYMGMLNIRERSNEDNVYSNYDGLEDLDMIEISHEKVNNVDTYDEELKEGTKDFYENFKKFYEELGHTKAEYDQWIDCNEYLNIMIMNLFYNNQDFPGNNIVFWRPNNDAKVDLPKIWRVIAKDTDFGLGLYNENQYGPDYNTIGWIYDPNWDLNKAKQRGDRTWGNKENVTLLFRHMLEDEDLLQMFIDKCSVYMGDFLNGKGTAETIKLIMDEAMEEFVAHRDKYNPGWGGGGWGGWGGGWGGQTNNRQEIENNFNNAKSWAEKRPENFYKFIGNKWNLGTAIPVTVNKDITDLPDSVVVNDIALSEGIFDGKLFPNRQYVITGKAPEGKAIKGWKVTKDGKSDTVNNSELALTLEAGIKSVSIEAILGDETGISTASVQPLWQWKRTVGGVNVSNVPAGEKVSIYDLRGVLLSESVSDGSDIFLPAASGKLYILKVGSESVKIQ